MSSLDTIPITKFLGVGPATQARLEKLNIKTVQDLLFHLPLRYEDRTTITPIRSLKIGAYAGIVGIITATEIVRRNQAMFLCQLTDKSGVIKLRFFNFAKQKLQFLLKPGVRLYCYGEVNYFGTAYEMLHPEYRILKDNDLPPVSEILTPVYPTTEKLSQYTLRKLMVQALNILDNDVFPELLPQEFLVNYNFPNIKAALHLLHRPPKNADIKLLGARNNKIIQRLIFEELLSHQLSLLNLRTKIEENIAPKILWDDVSNNKLLGNLAFKLTKAQEKVIAEIASDLAKEKPMLRLLQGDVGSGKTVVAASVILQTINSGFQAAIMAPTEILAEQHFHNIRAWLEPLNIQVCLITGKIQGKLRVQIYKEIEDGRAQVIIGTQAIFQEKIKFSNLGLIIIDEQHRFGVHQRLSLRDKGFNAGKYPHQLIMSATPIPRTLAMTVYADLDLSVIDELPKGRIKISTVALPNSKRSEVLTRVRENCNNGRQAYWVCPLIEESEILQCQAAEKLIIELRNSLPELNVGLVHGRMNDIEKLEVMSAFKKGKINLLVATTVIEVGVDVPNASLMIIENAERLGLVQLHQLRGRIGRGMIESFCVLLYQMPLSENAKERLEVMRESCDGFFIARKDMEMRGFGEVLGIKQTGLLRLKVADLFQDQSLLPEVQKTALKIFKQYPEVISELVLRWVGNSEHYGTV